MAIVKIENKTQFESDVRNSDKLVIVDFWAPWCGPCRILGPNFEEASNMEELSDVAFAKINVDEVKEIAAEFQIRTIPTLILMKNGNAIQTHTGMMSKDQLKEFIESNK